MKTTERFDRVRFKANLEDYRPVKWPPAGPYWCSGEGDNYSIIVAYFPSGFSDKKIREFWPEAKDIDRMNEGVPLTYSDRFAEPEWWKELRGIEDVKNDKA